MAKSSSPDKSSPEQAPATDQVLANIDPALGGKSSSTTASLIPPPTADNLATFTAKLVTFSKENIFLIVVIALGIFLRWYQLDDRPMHHDDSLFAIYGQYFFAHPEHQFYKYDPLLNGPLLFHLLPIIYHLFGPSDWSARVIPALLGSFFIFLPFFFRRYFTRQTLFFLVAFIAFSPNLVYWARFLRHEYLVLAAMMMVIWGATMAKGSHKAFWVLLGFTLQLCIKENSFVTLILVFAYLFFELVFNAIFTGNARQSMIFDIGRYIRRHPFAVEFALVASLAVLAYLFGAGFASHDQFPKVFRHSAGIADFFRGRGIQYWWNQHSIERISGPFSFTFLVLTWYDFLFMVAVLWHMIHFYRKAAASYLIILIATILVALTCHIINYDANLPEIGFYKLFKFKIHIDLYVFLLTIVHSINIVIYHLRHNEKYLAWWGYSFFATLFTYCYAGERVPWLAIYPLFFGVIYLAFYFQQRQIVSYCFTHRWGRHLLPFRPCENGMKSLAFILMVVLLSFNCYKSLMSSFTRGGSVSHSPQTEPFSQVHTTRMYKNVILDIRRHMVDPLNGHKVRVLSQGEGWPISWYLYALPEYHFIRGEEPLSDYDYIFYNRDAQDVPAELKDPQRYQQVIIPLRDWWVPDYRLMNPWNFLVYTFLHKPWNPSGSTDVIMYTPIRFMPLPPATPTPPAPATPTPPPPAENP